VKEAIAGVSDQPARQWEHRVFCMLAPDCLRRRLVRPVLDRFRDAGLEAVSWHLAPLSPVCIDAMSEAQGAGPGQTYRYRALDALIALGPALLLCLDDRLGRTSAEVYGAVRKLKGNADPQRAEAGSLRHDLCAVNAVLSLLHTSDSPEASAMESAILLGHRDVSFFQPGGLDEAAEVLELSQPRETRLFPEVLTAVRGRAATALWPVLTGDGRRLATKMAAKGQLAEPDAGERLCTELTGPADLAQVLRARFDGTEPAPAMSDVQHLLRAHRIELDAWEHTVLATSAYFPPRR